MPFSKSYGPLIENSLQKLVDGRMPHNLYDPIIYVLKSGGKRLRPSLVLAAAELYGKTPKTVILPALGIEVFHNFTLLHDDIMDEAPLRRNLPTVHKKWNNNTAILSGDAMMITATKLIASAEEKYLKQALDLFNNTAIAVCEGQQYDMDFELRDDVKIEEYNKMITLKTAVLLGCSLQLGGLLAGASPQDQINLYNFGKHLGIAFQLQDDLLDVFGNQNKFGKLIGGDIRSNKKTFLCITAFTIANNEEKILLHQALKLKNENERVKSVIMWYNKLNVKKLILNEIHLQTEIAMNYYNDIKLPSAAKSRLSDMSKALLVRKG